MGIFLPAVRHQQSTDASATLIKSHFVGGSPHLLEALEKDRLI